MKLTWLCCCCAMGAMACVPAAAEEAVRAGPTDASIFVPEPRYESAFSGYVRQRDGKLASWREANDEVARIGGHVGILRGNGTLPSAPSVDVRGK
jgi:hypothetical protein